MSARRFERPKVTEIRVVRGGPQGRPAAALSQRDVVTASLLARPDGREAGERSGWGRAH